MSIDSRRSPIDDAFRTGALAMWDYSETNAELYIAAKSDRWARSPMTYRRFETLALAIAFACEEPGVDLNHTTIRTDAVDMHGAEIRRYYDSEDFQLAHRSRKPRVPASRALQEKAG